MSLFISYLLIGLVMTAGLFLDRADKLRFDADSIKEITATVIVFLITCVAWPAFITKSNMYEVGNGE